MRKLVGKWMPWLVVGLMSQQGFAVTMSDDELVRPDLSSQALLSVMLSGAAEEDGADALGYAEEGDAGEGDAGDGDAGEGMSDDDNEESADGMVADHGGGLQVKDIFDIYPYDGEASLDTKFIGEWPQEVRLFANMVADPEPFLSNVSTHSLPLLIAGPAASGKSVLVHTIAAHLKARLWELEIGSNENKVASAEEVGAHGLLLVKALDAIGEELEEDEDLKVIVHLKKYDSRIDLQEIISNKKYKDIFERVFIVASLDVSARQDIARIVSRIDMFFKCRIHPPSNLVKKAILERLLTKRRHTLTPKDLDRLLPRLEKFNVGKFNKMLDIAYSLSLRAVRQPGCAIDRGHVEAAIADKLFEHEEGLSYFL